MPIKPGFSKFLEGHAGQLRKKCDLGPFDRLDPFLLAEKFGMVVRFVGPETGLPQDLLETVLGGTVGSWDAGTLKFPDGRIHVWMNPCRDKLRQHATLMEEIAHVHLGHQPSEIIASGGVVFRTCSKSNETQAYWLGAAALLPLRILKGARTRRMTLASLAEEHQVSPELTKFRCGLHGIELQAMTAMP